MPDDDKPLVTYPPTLSRRYFLGTTIGATAGALALTLLPPRLLAAQSAADTAISGDALYALSQKLVGSDDIDRDLVEPLTQLLNSQPPLQQGAAELAALDDPASDSARASLSSHGRDARSNILSYWFEGNFDGQPVPQRHAIFFSLPVWASVGYMTQPTMCKGFGYWAQDVTGSTDNAGAAGVQT